MSSDRERGRKKEGGGWEREREMEKEKMWEKLSIQLERKEKKRGIQSKNGGI